MRLAVLIDADNMTARGARALLAKVARYGEPVIKRAYGDWTMPHLAGWKDELRRLAIEPVQQVAYSRGKNATDLALAIGAMDLLHAEALDGFAIVSSDSDFTPLVTRLKRSGKSVYGFGRHLTPMPFVQACDHFVHLDLRPLLSAAISSASKQDGWSNLSHVGSILRGASFDPRDHGHAKLAPLVRGEPYVEVKHVAGPSGIGHPWVRLRAS